MSREPGQVDEFSREVVVSLNDSLEELDELTLQRLKAARAKALRQPRAGLGKWAAMGAAAAAITAVLLTPALWHKHTVDGLDADTVAVLEELPPSAEELDDLDMLLALEDDDA